MSIKPQIDADAALRQIVVDYPGSTLSELRTLFNAAHRSELGTLSDRSGGEALQRLRKRHMIETRGGRWYPFDRSDWPAWARAAHDAGWMPPKGWRPGR